ncbi:MAG: T9SS type A sorting domain-containing protein [Ignavibacteriae bacterium]|nr:T9SS type A sorting domain-containing protein [Ignavibacteriota bacterium]
MNSPLLRTALLFAVAMLLRTTASTQYATPTIDGAIGAGEYGTHTDGQNQQTSGGQVWYMTWDADNLYVGITNANVDEGAVIYVDKTPIFPINGRTDAAGTLVGQGYDGQNFEALQLRAGIVMYVKNGYREYRTSNGSNGWSDATTNFGSFASSGSNREFSLPWSALGGRPNSFAWFGLLVYAGGTYGQVPTENSGSGAAQRYSRYYHISSTANSSSAKPFSANSYVFNQTTDETNLGALNVFEFTMNSPGRTITRGTGAWVIARNLVVTAGLVNFGSCPDAATVGGSVLISSGATITLSSVSGGNLNLNATWSNNGTFNASGRAVGFNGTALQSVVGTTTFDNMSVNNPAGIKLNNPMVVNQTLTLTNGKVDLLASTLTVGAISGASSSNYVVTSGAGSLKHSVTGGSSFQFPVGPSATSYNPVTIELQSGDPAETFSVRVIGSVSPSSPDNTLCVQRTWDIGETTAGGNHATLTFQWAQADEGANFARALSSTFHYNSGLSRYDEVALNTPASGSNPYSTTQASPYQCTEFSSYVLGQSGGLPVQLSSFTGSFVNTRVELDWRTTSEVNNYGFNVQRKAAAGEWSVLGFVAGHGTTNSPQHYTFSDTAPLVGTSQYRLEQVDLDGTLHYSDPIQIENVTSVREIAPVRFLLGQNYPNPFNPSTEIKFSVEVTDHASLEVFNTLGQKVATLFDDMAEAGYTYKVQFRASTLASGTYFYKLQSGKKSELKKLLLLK